jgi:CRISPR-associated endonuclease Cas1
MTMGAEGQAGAAYWRRIADLLPSELGFSGRKGRGAKDPVNQCLNYVYALLYSEVWCAVARAGLDPYFGLIHGSQRDEGGLVFDLIEEFRSPFVDRLVFGRIGRGFHRKSAGTACSKPGKENCWSAALPKVGQNGFPGVREI